MKLEKLTKSAVITALLLILSACGGGGAKNGGTDSAAPEVPSGISATEGVYTDRVEIKWEQTAGAQSYVVYKSIDSRDQFRAIAADVLLTEFTDESVTPDRIYYYRVAAANGENWSDPSSDVRGFAHTGKPMTAETVTTAAGIGQISLEWPEVPQTDSYRILRSDSENGTYAEIANGLTTCSYTDSDPSLLRDTLYYYKIISVSDTEGESDPSVAVKGIALQDIPAAPESVTATNGTYQNKVEITWSASVNAVTYTIYRAPDIDGSAGTFIKIDERVTSLLYEDVSAEIDRLYHYSVSAVSSGGESAKSGNSAGRRLTGAPVQTAAPVNVTASKGNYNTITITWDAVDDSASYTVYRSTEINGTYLTAGTSAGESFTDNPPSLAVHYFYKVTSWSTGSPSVESYRSTYDEGYAMPEIADVPSGITATTDRTDARIAIAWNTSVRAVSYNIYRAESADGTYNKVASGLTALTFDDIHPSISAGRNYYYRIAAVNISGESSMSSPVTGKSILGIPSGFSTSQNSKKITLTWTAVPGATSYKIQRSKVSIWLGSGTYSDLITVSDTTFTDTDIVSSKRYYYRVEALNTGNTPVTESGYSPVKYQDVY